MLRVPSLSGQRLSPNWLQMVIVAAAWLLVVLGALGVWGYLHRGTTSATIAVSAFAPYLLALAVPALILSLVAWHWPAAVLAFALSVTFVVVRAPLWVSADAPDRSHALVVMTFNMRLGLADANQVVRTVRANHVDALMLEELTPEAQQHLADAGLDTALPHRMSVAAEGAARGTGLWSRYPLTAIDWPRLSFERIVARVAIPGSTVQPTLVALHVAGPIPKSINWGLDLKRLPGMLATLPADAPVVVGGDFNATRSVTQFRGLLTGGYADAADQAGAGLTRTYPADSWLPPLLGIDHVLTRDAVARSVDTVTIKGSDHRALVVRVDLPRGTDTR